MVRIAGIDIPDKKNIEYALPYIKGIGLAFSREILKQAQIPGNKKASELTTQEINKIKEIIDKNYRIEGDLRREVTMNIKRFRDIDSYRGLRHSRGLPVRGQRTKTNSRTIRGNVRRTMASGKRKLEKK